MSLLFLKIASYIFICNLNAANLTGSELIYCDCLEYRAPPKMTKHDCVFMKHVMGILKHDNLCKVSDTKC